MTVEFWSAIAGAVVGGLIAFGIQMIALGAAAKERREDRAERRKALAHALLFKLTQIYSHLRSFQAELEASFARAKKDGVRGEPWQIVRPFANSPDRIHFSTDEMAFLLSLREDDLFNDIVSMDERHNSTIDVFKTYSDRRFELTNRLPAMGMRGDAGTVDLTGNMLAAFRPAMVDLNSIITAARPQCEEQARDSWSALDRLRKVLSAKVGLSYAITLKAERESGRTEEKAPPERG